MSEEKKEKQFADGMFVFKPRENAPDFIKVNLSFRVSEFKEFLDKFAENDNVNVDVKVSKGGKWYADLNTYKPKVDKEVIPPKEEEIDPSDIPF